MSFFASANERREHMRKEEVLVVGLGEVGRSLFELLRESGKFEVHGFDVDEVKMRAVGQGTVPSKVGVMHVCIPCPSRDGFVNVVSRYVKQFQPKLVILNSTVPPGTTKALHDRCAHLLVAHSPVRGVHKSLEHMKWELKRWTKYVGGVDADSTESARRHFEKAGFGTKTLKSCSETELAKLFETTYRSWMIACFQEMHRITRSFQADFEGVVDFIEDTHRVRLDRPVMFPGFMGGHCLIPNVQLLMQSYDSEFFRLILKSNEQRKQDLEDTRVRRDVERVKHRVEAFERETDTESLKE
jgi:UDP-N-acetyl-D-mannosaminuronate dehydrogenase